MSRLVTILMLLALCTCTGLAQYRHNQTRMPTGQPTQMQPTTFNVAGGGQFRGDLVIFMGRQSHYKGVITWPDGTTFEGDVDLNGNPKFGTLREAGSNAAYTVRYANGQLVEKTLQSTGGGALPVAPNPVVNPTPDNPGLRLVQCHACGGTGRCNACQGHPGYATVQCKHKCAGCHGTAQCYICGGRGTLAR